MWETQNPLFTQVSMRWTRCTPSEQRVQIPVLAALLFGACAAKARRAISRRSIEEMIGPTAIFPVGLRRPMAIALFAGEFALGIGLVGHRGQCSVLSRLL